ncbi:hypothetical protein E0F15_20615 [Frankia sp. B2]|uniref:lytic transglycosylase domain-containing protein n=1 Tax=Frankia sp. B2 TaxID=2541730 RepID=UPI00106D1D08|nr:lytic transglycosylase domain-containing protein [Frankia sp. B2]TFE25062.1 hypothetical protein E0F15_20615 [Frankia sp. B2]
MTMPTIVVKAARSGVSRFARRTALRSARTAQRRLPAPRAAAASDGAGNTRSRPWWLLALLVVVGGNFTVVITGLIVAAAAAALIPHFLGGGDSMAPAPSAVTGIPAVVLDAYTQAARNAQQYAPGCTGMRWSILAGIGKIESGEAAGRQIAADGEITPSILGPRLDGSDGTQRIVDTDGGRWDGDTVFDRAVGPMQFIPSTWASMGRDGNGDGVADPNNIYDAAAATVVHLCGRGPTNLGDRAQLSRAIFGYNASDTYVANVLQAIDMLSALGAPADGSAASDDVPGAVPAPRGGDTIETIIAIMAKSGLPYTVSSTFRPGDTGSYHSLHEAVDFAMPGADNPQLLAINQYWARYATGLSELIYTGPGGTCVKDGAVVSCAAVYAAVAAEHHNHVHVAATPDMLRRIGVGADAEP